MRHIKQKPLITALILTGMCGFYSNQLLAVDGALRGKAPHLNKQTEQETFDIRKGAAHNKGEDIQNGNPQSLALKAIKATLSDKATVMAKGNRVFLSDPNGFLQAAAAGSPESIVRGYLKNKSAAFKLNASDVDNLSVAKSMVDPNTGTRLIMVPSIGGIPYFDNEVRANLTKSNQLINVYTNVRPNLTQGVKTKDLTPTISASDALGAAFQNANISAALPNVISSTGARQETSFDAPLTQAKLVLFDTGTQAKLGWRLLVNDPDTGNLYQYVVDAKSGAILYRASLTDHATGLAWDLYPDAAVGGSQKSRDFTPWLDFPDRLQGNNTHVWASVLRTAVPRPEDEIPPSNGTDYLYPFTPFYGSATGCILGVDYCAWDPDTPFSWQTNKNQNGTQLFYLVNNFHDYLKSDPIRFNEQRGNFQQRNFGPPLGAGDPVQVRGMFSANWDGSGLPFFLNNANMGTPPDGASPYMTMYLTNTDFGGGAINTGDDAMIVYHEYTHGLTNRLVVDADGFSLLPSAFQGRAMGEAWSDFYALDYLESKGFITDNPNIPGELPMSPEWAPNGLRCMPIDCPVGSTAPMCGPVQGCPGGIVGGVTLGDMTKILGFPNFHQDGQIWAQTLWDLRTRLIATYGKDKGLNRVRLIVTRALEFAPASSINFINMRDAILQADKVHFGGTDQDIIWEVFANRGMGLFALADVNGTGFNPAEDFTVPSNQVGSVQGIVASEAGVLVKGAYVAFEGPSFAKNLSAISNGAAKYSITKIPVGTYPILYANAPGYDQGFVENVTVNAQQITTVNLSLVRDWSASPGGAKIIGFNGPDYTEFGCGPGGAIDQTSLVWGSTSPSSADAPGSKYIIIQLPVAVNIDHFAIDPTAGCGDGLDASLGSYTIETSQDGVNFVPAANGAFTAADNNKSNNITPSGGTSAVRFVKLTMISSQDPLGESGSEFMDMTEIKVYGIQAP